MDYLSICACVRFDREWELLQWYKYHLATGVEHFYLLDDLSTIDINEFFEPKHLTAIDVGQKKNRKNLQHKLIKWGLANLPTKCKWVSYTDIDEFLFTKEQTFKDYLCTMEEYESVELKHRLFLCQGHYKPQKKRIFIKFLDRYKRTYTTKCLINNDMFKGRRVGYPQAYIHKIAANAVDAFGNKPYYPPDKLQGDPRHYPPDPLDQPAWTQHYPVRDKQQIMSKMYSGAHFGWFDDKLSSAQQVKSAAYTLSQVWAAFSPIGSGAEWHPENAVHEFNFKEEHPYVYGKFMKLYKPGK